MFLGDRVLTHTHRGQWIYVAADDVYMTPHLLKDGVWERHVERVVERLVRPGQTVADLGANVGYYTLALAAAVGPTGQVDAFEANPAAIRLLRDTLILNGLTERVRLHAAAVMDRPGTVTLAAAPHHLGSGNVTVGVADQAYLADYSVRTEVPAVTLDSTLARVPELHLLRIDIEGSEPLALRGAAALIERSHSLKIVTEWSPGMMAARADVREFADWLSCLGFRFWRIAADSSLEPVEPAQTPTLPHCDLVLARGAMP
jgi:FkbM family methyltransferase